jgi:methylamine dehydrogenase accessory protein MauD
MTGLLLISSMMQWGLILLLGFLVLGTLRSLGETRWQLSQVQATTPSRIGRDGLKPGVAAPAFILPTVSGGEFSLADSLGRRVLLVFTQSGCGPCSEILPELGRIHRKGEYLVVVVNNGELEESRRWAERAGVEFPVCVQNKHSLSKRFEAFATPFAFVVDEGGLIVSKGLVGTREHLGYVLRGSGRRGGRKELSSRSDGAEKAETAEFSSTREATHV